jgi:2-amino-4-hydroxy-6-hydroxymethyldihydropteridine diphosphokinase
MLMAVTEVFIGVGSNMGDRQANITSAVKSLSQYGKIGPVSSLYETEPVGFAEQPDFLNCVISLETGIAAAILLENLKEIEKSVGRKSSFRNAPRPIDLDILFYGKRIFKPALLESRPRLEIPHPRLHTRAFVLVPMAEIAPSFIHPVLKKSVQQMLSELAVEKRVTRWGELTLIS